MKSPPIESNNSINLLLDYDGWYIFFFSPFWHGSDSFAYARSLKKGQNCDICNEGMEVHHSNSKKNENMKNENF